MPQDPRLEGKYIKGLRNTTVDPLKSDYDRRQAAQELLRSVLGTTGQKLDAKIRDFWDFLSGADVNNPRTPTYENSHIESFRDEASPNVSAAYASAARDYPLAAKKVSRLYNLRDEDIPKATIDYYGGAGVKPGDFRGLYRNWDQSIGVRDNLPVNQLREVILHEMSHGMGTRDDFGDGDEPVGSYNISSAADILNKDINLPRESKSNLLKTLVQNYKLRKQ